MAQEKFSLISNPGYNRGRPQAQGGITGAVNATVCGIRAALKRPKRWKKSERKLVNHYIDMFILVNATAVWREIINNVCFNRISNHHPVADPVRRMVEKAELEPVAKCPASATVEAW